jgi:hypothetical protein
MRYEYIGWCQEGTSDKVWGAICLQEPTTSYRGDGKYVTFWGRRGKKLQTKMVEGDKWDVHKLFVKKLDKGYKEVDKQKLDEVYPDFESDLEKTAMWAALRTEYGVAE